MRIDPYLFYNGQCEEAIEFYKSAVGAQVQLMMRYGDSPSPPPPGVLPPGSESKIMHSSLLIGGALVMMADGDVFTGAQFKGFALSLDCGSEAEARQAFDALANGGQVTMPLSPTFWAPLFGMLVDRFGVKWMIGIAGPNE